MSNVIKVLGMKNSGGYVTHIPYNSFFYSGGKLKSVDFIDGNLQERFIDERYYSLYRYQGAWAVRNNWVSDTGVLYDQRSGLGTDRAPLPLRALDLNGTNQYGWIAIDPVTQYPFTLFGCGDSDVINLNSLVGVAASSSSSKYLNVAIDNGDRIQVSRRNPTTITTDLSTAGIVDGWNSYVVVFTSSTEFVTYQNGQLVSTSSGLTAVGLDAAFDRFVFGALRVASVTGYLDGRVQHVGFHRGSATLEDAVRFHTTGILTGTEEVNLPLDNNSTTVSYNIGRSASWWLNEPRRNLESYPQDLTNAVWRKSAVSSTTTKIVETATTAEHRIDNLTQFAVIAGETWSLSFSAKAAERTRIRAGFDSLGILNARGFFDLSNGTTDNTIAGSTYTITPDTEMGSGWYRCTVTSTAIGSGNVRIEINLVSGTGSFATTVSYLGDVANGAFVTNIQRERGVATTFQSVPGSGIEYPEATLVNAPTSYVGRDVPFSRQNKVGYSTRRNLLAYTRRFDNAYWSKTIAAINTGVGTSGIEPNVSASPDGTISADRVNFINQTDSDIGLNRIVSATGGQNYTFNLSLKGEGSNIGKNIRVKLKRSSTGTSVTSTESYTLTSDWVRINQSLTLASDNIDLQVIISSTTGGATTALISDAHLQIGTGDYQRIDADPGTNVLFPALLSDPTKSAATDALEFQGEAHMDGQLEDGNCWSPDGVDDYVAMNLGDVAGPELVPATYSGSVSGSWLIGPSSITRNGATTGQATFLLLSSLVVGRSYLISFDVSNLSGDTSGFRFPNAPNNFQISTNGPKSFVAIANNAIATFPFIIWGGGAGQITITNVSVKLLQTITHDGTSTLTYRSQGDGFTGTAGTAFNIRFGDIEHIPCIEGQGSILHGTLLEQEYSVVNGQANNWETFQDEYFYDVVYGFNLVSGVKIPASQVNPSLDVLGDPLSNPPRIGLNNSGATVNHSPVDDSWPDTYSIPGADLSNYEFDGDSGDIEIQRNRTNDEGKFVLEKS